MNVSISRDGNEIGEWTEEQVRAYYKEGLLVPTDHYWIEGMPAWKELGTFIKPLPPLPKELLGEAASSTQEANAPISAVTKKAVVTPKRITLGEFGIIIAWAFLLALLAVYLTGQLQHAEISTAVGAIVGTAALPLMISGIVSLFFRKSPYRFTVIMVVIFLTSAFFLQANLFVQHQDRPFNPDAFLRDNPPHN